MKCTNEKGFTLVELLVAIAVVSIVMGAVVSTYQLQVRGKNTQEALTDLNQTTRTALEIMTNEIRTAGFDPLNSPTVAGIVTADDDELRFTMDIGDGASFQPDGDTNDPNEDVRYAISGTGHLGRQTAGDPFLQPLARNVDALNFVYLDGNDPPTRIPTPVAAGQLNNIRSIEVTIVARAGEAGGVGFVGRHTDTAAYQNQRGDEILAAQNDAYRRVLLTTTIQCRNIGL